MEQRHEYKDIWEAVVNERQRQGLTLEELERRTGIPRVTISKWLRGVNAVPLARAITLAEALDIQLSATVTKRQQQSQATEVAA